MTLDDLALYARNDDDMDDFGESAAYTEPNECEEASAVVFVLHPERSEGTLLQRRSLLETGGFFSATGFLATSGTFLAIRRLLLPALHRVQAPRVQLQQQRRVVLGGLRTGGALE